MRRFGVLVGVDIVTTQHSFLLYYVGIDGVTFILEHTIAQQLLSNGLAACSLINYQGRGLATSELTLRQHTPGRS